jgi:ComF family protein
MAVAAPVPPVAPRPHWRYRARQLAWAAVDLILPPECGGCGRSGRRLCPDCQRAMLLLGQRVCARCGYPSDPAGGCHICGIPFHDIGPLTGLRSAAYFEGPLQRAIHRLKYKHDVSLADALAPRLVDAWSAYQLPTAWITAVPLAPQRLHERGYNQAALLARAMAQLLGLPYLPRTMVRVRSTPSQVGLDAAARQANVAGAFRADSRHVAGRNVIVVDDVCTTGATLAACGTALVQAGAAHVWGLTLGRARYTGGRFREARARGGAGFSRRQTFR